MIGVTDFAFFHRDGKMPVTFIQKYLVKKLELNSEAEVSILLLPCNKLELGKVLYVRLLGFLSRMVRNVNSLGSLLNS